jgi:hypothetical protein
VPENSSNLNPSKMVGIRWLLRAVLFDKDLVRRGGSTLLLTFLFFASRKTRVDSSGRPARLGAQRLRFFNDYRF